MEDSQLLERHFAGDSLRDLAKDEGVSSAETMRQRLLKAKRDYITQLAGELLVARREGTIVWPLVIVDRGPALHVGLQFFDWMLRELEGLTIRCRVHVVSKPDGIAFGIEEYVDADEGGDEACP
jgi:hypothetical protein